MEGKLSSPSSEASEDAVRLVHSLFLANIDLIRGFIRGLVRDRHLADDVLQETFLTITRKAGQFEEGTSFPKWACTVARLKVLEMVRRESSRHRFFAEETLERLASDEAAEEQDYRLDHLRHCIDRLPASMRKLVHLRYVLEQKPAEIAKRVGWTVEAVYVSLSRARSGLKECLETRMAPFRNS
ncbi:RNA polymerase sigma-70 factor (ECF subfamily) [Haloferula luteola]|uniref:RNA polymerase sigma-70 factor (ECF subfamily) n=1 Tax=Haloferula luteola TaxID=595692 RepID=A0A840V8E1_9BACT|nr:sigma-70 family RNA polymerase sigma factor [Haloferula luteola]MBB5350049.1 RNA polymerase sigma-70 factor (ECF subfamily) [Haloferula luteola]